MQTANKVWLTPHEVEQMSTGQGYFSTTMKYYTRVPADLQKKAAEAL